MPGRHNLLNALGAVAVGLEVGVPFAKIASGFEDFRGAERRFQLRGEARGVMVVDDYGHHPTEIAAVIAAARAGLDRRVVVVFQPHRYTRTRDLLEAFGAALGARGRDRPDRHLRRRRGADPRRHRRGGRSGSAQDRAVP